MNNNTSCGPNEPAYKGMVIQIKFSVMESRIQPISLKLYRNDTYKIDIYILI